MVFFPRPGSEVWRGQTPLEHERHARAAAEPVPGRPGPCQHSSERPSLPRSSEASSSTLDKNLLSVLRQL